MKEISWLRGWFSKPPDNKPDNYDFNTYSQVSDEEKLREHRDHLNTINLDENNRLELIENKTARLVSFIGVAIPLLCLFISLLIDKMADQNIVFRIFNFLLLVSAVGFYIRTIYLAGKNFDVDKFKYQRPSPNDVIKYQNLSTKEFISIEIKDLFKAINQNTKTNNTKATNLRDSSQAFKFANIFTGLLIVSVCFSILFMKEKRNEVILNNPIIIQTTSSTDDTIKIFTRPKAQLKNAKQEKRCAVTPTGGKSLPSTILK